MAAACGGTAASQTRDAGCRAIAIADAGDPFGGRCRVRTVQAFGVAELFAPNGRHNGIDLACEMGAAIFSVTPGVVFHVEGGCANGARDHCGGGYGNHVVVRVRGRIPDDTGDHDYYVVYGHMVEAPRVRGGQQVQPGIELGREGDSGLSWGAHLHFEVDRDGWQTARAIDPSPFLSPTISRSSGE